MKRYNLEEGAEFLGIKPRSLLAYVYSKRINARKTPDGIYFDEKTLKQYRNEHTTRTILHELSEEQQTINFDAIYGKGSYQKLLELFEKPCNSYQSIADEFGVTKECVSRWYDDIFPDKAGRGNERRHMCAVSTSRKELFENTLFANFYRIARSHFPQSDIGFVSTKYATGKFRTRDVKLKNRKVMLRRASRIRNTDETQKFQYRLNVPVEDSKYVFYMFPDEDDFLFIPKSTLPEINTIYTDAETSKYYKYKNSFGALVKSSLAS